MTNFSYVLSMLSLALINFVYVISNSVEVGFWNAYLSQWTDPFCWGLGIVGGVIGFVYHWGNEYDR